MSRVDLRYPLNSDRATRQLCEVVGEIEAQFDWEGMSCGGFLFGRDAVRAFGWIPGTHNYHFEHGDTPAEAFAKLRKKIPHPDDDRAKAAKMRADAAELIARAENIERTSTAAQ